MARQAPTSRGVQAKAGVCGDAVLYPFDDLLQVRGIVDEVKKQAVDRQDGAFGVFRRPLLVVAVEQAQVIQVNRIFNRPGTLLDPFNQGFNRRNQADQQGGLGQLPEDQVIQFEIGLVVPVREIVHLMQRAHKNVSILVNATIHDGRATRAQQGFDPLGAMTHKLHLKMKCPGVHIGVEIGQIGVVVNRLIGCLPTNVLAELLGEGCFAAANISCQDNQTLLVFKSLIHIFLSNLSVKNIAQPAWLIIDFICIK